MCYNELWIVFACTCIWITHSSMALTSNVHCMTVPTLSLLISLSLLAGCSKGQVCACVFGPLFLTCAVRCVGARPWEHGLLYDSSAQITLTHLCGCGVLNEVSKFIGGCKICTNVICLALNSHSQCKTFVGHFDWSIQSWVVRLHADKLCYTGQFEWLQTLRM